MGGGQYKDEKRCWWAESLGKKSKRKVKVRKNMCSQVQIYDMCWIICKCMKPFVCCDSDVCLYVSIARKDVSIGAALGLLQWRRSGQHVGGRGRLLW